MAENIIELPQLEIQAVEITVVGDSPLIMHKWSEKAKSMMRNKQQKKATQGREAKDPKKEFEDSIHRCADGGPGFPSIGFKAAAVTSCTSIASVGKLAAQIQTFTIMVRLRLLDLPEKYAELLSGLARELGLPAPTAA